MLREVHYSNLPSWYRAQYQTVPVHTGPIPCLYQSNYQLFHMVDYQLLTANPGLKIPKSDAK